MDFDHPYAALSLRDLLDAREQSHAGLMKRPNVVGTAIGYYRIRIGDSRPGQVPEAHQTCPRTFANSEVRDYSWPAILAIVSEWEDASEFAAGGRHDPGQMVPKAIELKDGRAIPVCVIQAPRELEGVAAAAPRRLPLNNIGCGHPLEIAVQGRAHFATVACLVDDGHRTFALTNRHVTGAPGETVSAVLDGRERAIGRSAAQSLTRRPFKEVYPGWSGDGVYLNMDIGLVDIEDLNRWTAKLPDVDGSRMGPLVDLSSTAFPLSLVGQPVRGWGAASGLMTGEIQGLFYRYKARGGFEYVADFLIGPRTGDASEPFVTRPGDSGTLWLLEAPEGKCWFDGSRVIDRLRPLAVQWGSTGSTPR